MNRQEIDQLLKKCSYRQRYIKNIQLDVTDEYSQLDVEGEMIEQAIDNIDWPLAVDPQLIIKDDAAKFRRAENIISVFTESIDNKKVLDYGCGEGHLVHTASKSGTAYGYDPVDHHWTLSGTYTTTPDGINQFAPYDAIFLYDVLDHTADPIHVLTHVQTLMHQDTEVYVRCHPWCSRHGGHLFKEINRAYLHLFLNDTTNNLLTSDYPLQKTLHPLGTYGKWFNQAGLKIKSEEPIQTEVEPFFYAFTDQIQRHWKTSPLPEFAEGRVFPSFPMSIEFVDYVLTK